MIIELSPNRPLDATAPVDYATTVAYAAFCLLCACLLLFIAVNKLRRNRDISILGAGGLTLLVVGAVLDTTSEFITNGHLDALEGVRTIGCYEWDYWLKMTGFGFFFSGLCICMANTSIFLMHRVQSLVKTFQKSGEGKTAPQKETSSLPRLLATDRLSNGAYIPQRTEMEDEKCMVTVEIEHDSEDSGDLEEEEEQRHRSPTSTSSNNTRSCRFCLKTGITTCAGLLCFPCMVFVIFWRHTTIIGRLRATGFITVTTIMLCVLAVVGLSYIPGVTSVPEGSNTCYTRVILKVVVAVGAAVLIGAAWLMYFVANVSKPREVARLYYQHVWNDKLKPVLYTCLEVVLLFLNKGIYLLGNPISLALLRCIAPLYLTDNGHRFDTRASRFVATSKTYLARALHTICCCCVRFCASDASQDSATSVLFDPIYGPESIEDRKEGFTDAKMRYYAFRRESLRSGLFNTGNGSQPTTTTATEHTQAIPNWSVYKEDPITGSNFNLALKATTLGIGIRIALNVLCVVSYVLGRTIYMVVTIGMYVVALAAILGDAYISRLRGTCRSDDSITRMSREFPNSFSQAISTRNDRVTGEFLDFAHAFIEEKEKSEGATHLFNAFTWKNHEEDNGIVIRVLGSIIDHLDPRLRSKEEIEADGEQFDTYIHIGHMADFLEQYLICKSLFEEARENCLNAETEDEIIDTLLKRDTHNSLRVAHILTENREKLAHLFEDGAAHYASPIGACRQAVIRATPNPTVAFFSTEADIAIGILDELLWHHYVEEPTHMAWMRVIKAYADVENRRAYSSRSNHHSVYDNADEAMDQFDAFL